MSVGAIIGVITAIRSAIVAKSTQNYYKHKVEKQQKRQEEQLRNLERQKQQ